MDICDIKAERGPPEGERGDKRRKMGDECCEPSMMIMYEM